MHLLATRPGGYAAGDGIVDLAQSPADVVILSAADTDLRLLAEACETLGDELPALRLASLLALRSNGSVDLYFDQVLRHARLVVVALMGGQSYWPYGVERLVEHAREAELELVFVPGDDAPDPELDRLSSVGAAECRRISRYLREGGADNARRLLRFLAHRFFARGADPGEPLALPRVAIYHPAGVSADFERWRQTWQPTAAVAALLFYRAHLQAGNLAAFDALIAALIEAGLNPLPIAVASLKDTSCRSVVAAHLRHAGAALVLNTTGFAIASLERGGSNEGALGLDRPVLQVIMSGGNAEDWRAQPIGLSPRDLAMSVVLPEVDGRIITRAVSWKGLLRRSARAEIDVAHYHIEHERAQFVARLAANWVRLARTPAAERRIALVLANYPARDGRIGNGVGLDTPESALEILRALRAAGYAVGDVPADSRALMALLQAHPTNEHELVSLRYGQQSLALSDYAAFLAALPAELGESVTQRWGPPERDPRVRSGRFLIAGLQLGATFIGIQPARGYEIDPSASYHDPDLVPPHGYLAFYAWLRRHYDADAIVHVGKHGNLEWLPGKSVALDKTCWPDAVFGPLPHLYPFIVNDPGEGTQAKRRSQAVIIDHLVPPLTRAETYGPLRDLERLVDEYYQALVLDPPRAQVLRRDILAAAKAANLHRELATTPIAARGDARSAPLRAATALTNEASTGSAGELRASSLSPSSATPARDSAAARAEDDDRLLVSIDAYLCELKESQIRDGLHIFGRSPTGTQRLDTLVALARLPAGRGQGPDEGLLRSLSNALLRSAPGAAPDSAGAMEGAASVSDQGDAQRHPRGDVRKRESSANTSGARDARRDIRKDAREQHANATGAEARERLDRIQSSAAGPSRTADPVEPDGAAEFDPLTANLGAPWRGPRPKVLEQLSSDAWRTAGDTRERLELFARAVLAGDTEAPAECAPVLERIRDRVAPALDRSGSAELAGLLAGLDGRFVAPGPSGAPSRGRLDVLPTGRNFYSVDTRALPTPAAWRLGQRAAASLVERYVQDHGEYPRAIGLSVWGTATMRTGGDDIAQALALLGVRPIWAEGSARVVDSEVLPVSTLRRPRVDVVLRISGFFRDAFPELIRLVDSAVRAVAELDEPEDQNPLRARVLRDEQQLRDQGASAADAAARARWRIFGSKPGAYGAGLQGLIDRGNWRERHDLAHAYLEWSGYAYAGAADSEGAAAAEGGRLVRAVFQSRLAGLDAVLQNQDNREHDLLDSDDYYQFQGGLSAAVELARGSPAALYHGDHANPEAPRVRSLREELSRVVRSRVVNPKWIEGVRRHGYKGAAEMAATVDFLFGYDAATGIVEDYQYALVSDAYLLDPENRDFLAANNPSALREMAERLVEAMQRGMWSDPGPYREALEDLLLEAEEC